MQRNYLPGTTIELCSDIVPGNIKHVLFDFDGTISLLREGWESVMQPVCVEMVCGSATPTPEIELAVAQMIDETTGIQTILQMEKLLVMIREFGLVPESGIQTAAEYKKIYLDRLIKRVKVRLEKLKKGTLSIDELSVLGVHPFLENLSAKKTSMYVFSGTDRDDVLNEASSLNVAHHFLEIWGALESIEAYSKEKVLKEIIANHELSGNEIMAVGDGPVEIRNIKEQGGIAVGVASDEEKGFGLNEHKRERLLKAGADIIIGDFEEGHALLDFLFPAA